MRRRTVRDIRRSWAANKSSTAALLALTCIPQVCAGIDREYDEKVKYWPSVFGEDNVPTNPTKPTPFHHSLFVLDGNVDSPIVLLGPLQGDSVDHTLFWLPSEKTIICGDAVYARSTHVW